jgi:hypothetical protein
MRTLLVTLLLANASIALAEEPASSRVKNLQTDERWLTAAEIERYAAPYLPEIKQCYLAHARPARTATGNLALRLVVFRNGTVIESTVDAPGVTGKRLRELDHCVRAKVATWHFPMRKYSTTAILPYYFLKLDLPGTGPQPSCWNPRGCKTRPDPAARPKHTI